MKGLGFGLIVRAGIFRFFFGRGGIFGSLRFPIFKRRG